MPKVLITGASGLLGRALVSEFTQAAWDVVGLAYSRAEGVLKKVDLKDCQAVRKVLHECKPDVVIHAAAERRPDVVENSADQTRKLNVDATSTIAAVCGEIGAYIIYVSTDYVFDGRTPPYKPDDQTNPLNKYGQSKLDGERVVRAEKLASTAILRVPILYGQVEYLEESAVTVLVKNLFDPSQPAMIDDYQIRWPTNVCSIAAVCRQMSDMHHKKPSFVEGVFHMSDKESMSKFTMTTIMADIFNLKKDHLVANQNPPTGTPRPHDCTMDCSALTSLGIGRQTSSFREAIEPCLRPFLEKKGICHPNVQNE